MSNIEPGILKRAHDAFNESFSSAMRDCDRFCDYIESVGEANQTIYRAIEAAYHEIDAPKARESVSKIRQAASQAFQDVHNRFMSNLHIPEEEVKNSGNNSLHRQSHDERLQGLQERSTAHTENQPENPQP